MNNNYFDLQVNGYAGVDFNQNDMSLDDFATACLKLEQDGVVGILATVITASIPDMVKRVSNIVSYCQQSDIVKRVVKGIHLEGPFLNPADGYRGAHPQEHINPANLVEMKVLQEACAGLLKLVTLAPEYDHDNEVTKYLVANGVVVSAGHCDPDEAQLQQAIDAGLSMFTHLGNGCPQQLHRHDNIIQRALRFKDDLWLCFIADGHHVPFTALSNYLSLAGIDRCIVTTDAMAAAGARAGQYTLSHVLLEVGEDRVVREPGKPNFAGSAADMKESEINLMENLKLTQQQVKTLTLDNPLAALQISL